MQKYVETLDMLKIKNTTPTIRNGGQNAMQHPPQRQSNGQRRGLNHERQRHSNGQRLAPIQEQQTRHSFGHMSINQQAQEEEEQQQQSRHSTSGVVVTTKWETFDSAPALVPIPSTSTSTSATHNSVKPKFNWELFE